MNKGSDNKKTAAHGRGAGIIAVSLAALSLGGGLVAEGFFQTPEAQAAPDQTQSQQANQTQVSAEALPARNGITEASAISSIPDGSLTAHFAPTRMVYVCKGYYWVTTGKGMGGYKCGAYGWRNVP